MDATRFHSAREAKEFIAAHIADQAMRDAIPFSDVERKMLLFSEVGWAPPDTMEVAAEFDRQFDQAEYEKKVATIIKHLDKRLRKDSPAEYDDWKLAVEYLKRKDHYINVMIGKAGLRLHWDQLKLFATALLLAAGLACYGFIAAKYKLTLFGRDRRGPGPKSYDDSHNVFMWIWLIGTVAAISYYLLGLTFGTRRVEDSIERVWRIFFRSRKHED
jgi:hypothetical protein